MGPDIGPYTYSAAGGWPRGVDWTASPAVLAARQGPGLGLSGYPVLLVEEVEDLVDYTDHSAESAATG